METARPRCVFGGWSETEVGDLGAHLVGVIGLELNSALGVDQDQGRDRLDAVGIGEASRGVKDPWTRHHKQSCDPARVSHYQACPGNAMPGGGRRERGFLLGDPQGVEGIKAGIGTSVTASRMTDAYGASTLRVPHG